MSNGFVSIQSTLTERGKGIKSKKDIDRIFLLKKFKNNYWTGIPNKLLFDENIHYSVKFFWMLLQETGDANGYSYYNQENLATLVNKNVKSVQRYDKKLVEAGWLKSEPGKGHASKDYYTIWRPNCPNPKQASAIKKSKQDDKR